MMLELVKSLAMAVGWPSLPAAWYGWKNGEPYSAGSPVDPGSVVGGDCGAASAEPNDGVGVLEETGDAAVSDHEVPAHACVGAFRDVFRHDRSRGCLKGFERISPWNPWEGEL
jgi:hypothetical protein